MLKAEFRFAFPILPSTYRALSAPKMLRARKLAHRSLPPKLPPNLVATRDTRWQRETSELSANRIRQHCEAYCNYQWHP